MLFFSSLRFSLAFITLSHNFLFFHAFCAHFYPLRHFLILLRKIKAEKLSFSIKNIAKHIFINLWKRLSHCSFFIFFASFFPYNKAHLASFAIILIKSNFLLTSISPLSILFRFVLSTFANQFIFLSKSDKLKSEHCSMTSLSSVPCDGRNI